MTLRTIQPGEEVLSATMTQLVDQLRRTQADLVTFEGQGASNTVTSYLLAADRELLLNTLTARYLHLAAGLWVSAGTGYCRIRIKRVSDGATEDLVEWNSTQTALAEAAVKYHLHDMSALTTLGDVRGVPCRLQVHLKVTTGTVHLDGLTVIEGESATGADYLE